MKRNRIILAVLWLASLLAISFYGGPVSYGIFAFFTMIPLMSLLYIVFVMFRFRIYQEIDGRNLKANNPSDLYFTLQNESPLAFSSVRVLFYSTFSTISGLSDKTEYELLPGKGIKKNTGIVCHYRGEYEVGIKKVVITDFLRLFSITYNNREPYTVTVKPDIVHLETLKDVEDLTSIVDNRNARKIEPDVLSRQYMTGDDVRFINWKQSAAKGELMMRDTVGTGQQGIAVIMDPKRYGTKKEEYLPPENRMLEILIALTLYFCNKNIPVNVIHTPDQHNKNIVEKRNFEAFYQGLSDYSFKSENDPAVLFDQVMRRGDIFEQKYVFLILRNWDEKTLELVERLSRRSIPAAVYLVDSHSCKSCQGDGSAVNFSEKDDSRTVPLTPLPENVVTRTVPLTTPLTEVM
ncbi:MAG: DUF58 domain-containing protein [Lachnospiraceae bacterium]|nr:DUF58 domain-containing protein [Lachnospiraceae bacterium]